MNAKLKGFFPVLSKVVPSPNDAFVVEVCRPRPSNLTF